MDFEKFLKSEARKVEKELEKLLRDWERQVKKFNPKLTPFAKGLIDSTKGGKKVRGILVKLGYELAMSNLKSQMSNDILKIAASYEILHAALLIHDDIADKSLTRRGKPSLYTAFGANHYGISQAINVGDIGFYLSIKIITDSQFPAELKIKALSFLSEVIINTGWGQVLDVAGLDDREFININKTAKYTIAGPLQIGAILAGADERLIRQLGVFGENAGIAFQIQDDILDGEVISLDSAKAQALEYITKAKKVIPNITKDLKMSKLLEQFADYLVERTN